MDLLETFFCLNILLFAIFTWYSLDNPNSNKEAAAYTSATSTIIVLLLIILYHVYTYASLFSIVKRTKLGGMIDQKLTSLSGFNWKIGIGRMMRKLSTAKPRLSQRHYSPTPDDDDDIHGFDDRGEELNELYGPINTNDYNENITAPYINLVGVPPTHSELELQLSNVLAPPEPNAG